MGSISPPSHYALVVDDDGLIRMDVADILEEAGFHAIEASSGDHALEVLRTHHERITLLFTDVQMPGTRDGFALAREAARHYPLISIVVASGLTQPKPGDMPEGACFIAKPFSANIVHRHLREVLPEDRKPHQLKA